MCGRGDQTLSWAKIHELLQIAQPADASNLQPNYNVAPTQEVFVCTEHEGARRIEQMRWGLVPIWAKELPKYSTFNAKADGLTEKATWKGSLNKMRCIVPFSGFYEWTGPKGKKQPYRITRKDGDPLLMAGLWAFNDKIDGELRSFTIITTKTNKVMSELHHRMPVILSPKEVGKWLAGPWDEAKDTMLKPCPDSWLTASPVSTDVGSVRNNKPELTEPIGDPIF